MADPEFDQRSFLASLPAKPGVYRMIDADGKVLYVGKARHLRDRVKSYFHGGPQDSKTLVMLGQMARIEVTVTASEIEALLLEDNLVKRHRPRYNVMLRDDKSFPYIRIATEHPYPRVSFYRGPRKPPDRYFGPYPSAVATRETLLLLQKLFRVRPCEDSFFANRTRPCLQYQIQRCTAPCVALISREEYARDIGDAMRVLDGRNTEVIADLGRRMEEASQAMRYEDAARLRDSITMLKRIQADQAVTRSTGQDIDAVAIAGEGGEYCVSVVFVRGGRNLGSSNYFPKGGLGGAQEALSAFLAQYYLERGAPPEVLVTPAAEDSDALAAALSERSGHAVRIRSHVRGTRARWLAMARTNAELGLRMRASSRATIAEQLDALTGELQLGRAPARIECFDVSHTMGELAVASCVVFGADGPIKSEYRRFNLRGLTPGDDYAGLRQAVERRFVRILRGESPMPDLLLIDGGPGQLRTCVAALIELGVPPLVVAAVAKGADRRVGQERVFLAGQEVPLILAPDSPALRLIQRIRDEAHRFAISGHRRSREGMRRKSPLEEIPGLGPKRRTDLLKAFGGLQGIRQASIEDLAKVHGISRKLAAQVFERMNPGT